MEDAVGVGAAAVEAYVDARDAFQTAQANATDHSFAALIAQTDLQFQLSHPLRTGIGIGPFSVSIEANAVGMLVRRKVAYDQIRGEAGLEAPGRLRVEVVASRTAFAADLSKVEASETLRFPGDGLLPGASARSTLTLTRLESGQAALSVNLAGVVGGPVFGPPTEEALQFEMDRAKDPGGTLSELVGRASTPDLERVTRDRLYLALVARLRWSEAAVAEAKARIEANGEDAALLSAAMGHAGSPACQRVLVGLVRQGAGYRVANLANAPRPTPETVAALTGWLDDPRLARQAMYTLGAVVHRLRDRAPEQAQEALAPLLGHLGRADSPRTVVTVLRALGNAGHPGALPALSPYLAANDASIRLEAVKALRRIPGASVDSRLDAMARADRARRVRQAASALLVKRRGA